MNRLTPHSGPLLHPPQCTVGLQTSLELEVMPTAAPSPLNGERAGVRGVNIALPAKCRGSESPRNPFQELRSRREEGLFDFGFWILDLFVSLVTSAPTKL